MSTNLRYCHEYDLAWPVFDEDPLVGIGHMLMRVTDCDVVAKHVRTKGIAVQAGGHIGLWPRRLAQHFAMVISFEPAPELFRCAQHNLAKTQNVVLRGQALGPRPGTVHIQQRWGGKSALTQNTEGELVAAVEQITIDSLKLPRCDLIYLDIEGYETEALAGAQDTIAKFKPVIALEALKSNQGNITGWANSLGYSRTEKVHHDWIFVP